VIWNNYRPLVLCIWGNFFKLPWVKRIKCHPAKQNKKKLEENNKKSKLWFQRKTTHFIS
jgi:hypothetical protein